MSVGHADSAETVYVRVLSAVYEAVLANGDFTTKALEPLETARQLVRAFRVRSVGANVSLPGLGGGLYGLDEAAHELVGYGPRAADAPMSVGDVRAVLRHRYAEELEASLNATLAGHLRRLAERGPGATFTQKELVAAWKVTQPAVSPTLGELQRHGYVTEVERRQAAAGEAGGRGRPQTGYALTGAARIVFDEPPAPPAR